MELSELTAYAEKKFHMQEQHNWSDFPGFSVLADQNTGKWVALLMRQWDYNTGTEIQRCDIKCGQRSLTEISASYLSLPFRMKGKKWVGVKFEKIRSRKSFSGSLTVRSIPGRSRAIRLCWRKRL